MKLSVVFPVEGLDLGAQTAGMDEKRKFGRHIKALRKARGLSQERLAELIDRSTDAVSNIERGLSLPSYETLIRLSGCLSVPLNELHSLILSKTPHQADERQELELALSQIVQTMHTRVLRIAVEQMQVLAQCLGTVHWGDE